MESKIGVSWTLRKWEGWFLIVAFIGPFILDPLSKAIFDRPMASQGILIKEIFAGLFFAGVVFISRFFAERFENKWHAVFDEISFHRGNLRTLMYLRGLNDEVLESELKGYLMLYDGVSIVIPVASIDINEARRRIEAGIVLFQEEMSKLTLPKEPKFYLLLERMFFRKKIIAEASA